MRQRAALSALWQRALMPLHVRRAGLGRRRHPSNRFVAQRKAACALSNDPCDPLRRTGAREDATIELAMVAAVRSPFASRRITSSS